MYKKRKIGFLVFILMIAMSTVACMGTISPVSTAPSPLETNPSSPSGELNIIPTSTSAEALTSTSTAVVTDIPQAGGQVNIVDINGFKDEANYWYFSGLVRNDTSQTITDLQVAVRMLDSAGTEVYSYTTYSMLTYLAPGESSPFSDFTTEPFTDGNTIQATIVGSSTIDSINRTSLEYRGITLWADDQNDVYLAGEVLNNSSEPVEVNGIAGTLTDLNGKLVTASSAYPYLTYIEPGSVSPFVMMFDSPLGMAASLTDYSLYSDALVTNPTSTYDISISEKHSRYQDSIGDMHLVGSVTNNITEPLNIYLVAALYDKNGKCIDANVVFLPIPLNPGETFPYDFSLWGAVDYVPAAYEAISDYKIYVDWLSTYEASSGTYTLTTKDDTYAFDGIVGRFTGTVVNDSGQDLTTALVSVSIYDNDSGELVATNLNFVTEPMGKDATGTYEVFLYPPNDMDPSKADIVIVALGQ